MPDEEKLLANRWRLARELRRLREQADLSGRRLAERVGISQSKVSRIESCATIPTHAEVAAWADATGLSASAAEKLRTLVDAAYTEFHPWKSALQERVHLQHDIQEIENATGVKLVYEPSIVPGLLQIAEYARRVFTQFEPAYPAVDVPAAVAGRLDRQVALFDPARRFEFVVAEAALRFRIAPVDVMLAQLDRIESLSTLENVSIGLIPQSAPAVTHVPHGFVVFEPADDEADTLVMVETVHANLTVADPGDVELYKRQWSLLQGSATFGGSASGLLRDLAAELRALPPESVR
ncbi:helix-turn-helix domain-containing protein [Actinomadura syzygii]|uniref:helix-turn-helix domain-containing protein n=1 Tax=Actinomadura syzygii TaxID=1427538 RepID=UPI001FEC606C|nr:helix-turn-helix transcriptional regulator [Actinomadura syzygii]